MARDDISSIVAEAEREFPGLRVTSADRNVGQNAAAGGARDSQHLHGRARDLDISGVPEDRRPALLQYFRQRGVTGMGMYSPTGTSLHVDIRPGAFTAWGPDRRSSSLTQTPSYFQEAVRGTPVLAQATAVGDGSGADPAAGGSGSSTTTPPPGGARTTPPATLSPALQSIFGGMRGRIEKDIGLTRRQGEIQQEQALARATGTRDAQRSMAAAERAAAEQFRSRPIPAFVPTQETAADMGTLFSLLAVAGQTLGGRGKTGAMAAMSAMTGMLNGYRQGRQDLYQKERQNFEAGLRQIQAQNQALQENYNRAVRASQTDMQGALAEAERRAIELGAPLAALAARRSGIQGFNTVDQAQMQVVSQLESRVQAQYSAEQLRLRTLGDQQRRDETLRANRVTDQRDQERRAQAEADRVRGITTQEEERRNARERQERIDAEGRRQQDQIADERRRNLQQAGMRAQYIIENQPEDKRARTVEVLSRAASGPQVAKSINEAYTIFESSEAAARQVAQYRDAVGPLGAALNRFRADPATAAFGSVGNWLLGRVPEGTTDQAVLSAAAARDEATMNRAIDRDVERGLMSPDMAARAKILSKTLFSLALADAQATGRPTVFLERALSEFYSQSLRDTTLLEIIHGRAEEATRRLPDPALRPNTLTNYNDNFSILASMRDNRFDPQAFLERHPQVGRGGDAPRRPPNAVTPGGARAPGRPSATPSGPATQRWDPVSGRLVPVE